MSDDHFNDFDDFDHSQPYRPHRPPEMDDYDDFDYSQPYEPQHPPDPRSRFEPTSPTSPRYVIHPNQPQRLPYQPYHQLPAQPTVPPRLSYNPFAGVFWHDMSTFKISVVTVLCVLLTLTVCVVPFMVAESITARSVHSSVALQPTTPTIPTLPPQLTDTPKPAGPQPLDAPTLGGLWSNFENTYGSEVSGQQDMWGATIAGQQVAIMVDFSQDSDGADGQSRAAIINLMVPPELVGQESWSASTANTIAHAFLPADAKYVSDRQYTGWVDHTERTSRLAASFIPGIFTIEDGDKTVTPGDLHWVCDLTTQMDNCYVSVGTTNQ